MTTNNYTGEDMFKEASRIKEALLKLFPEHEDEINASPVTLSKFGKWIITTDKMSEELKNKIRSKAPQFL